MNSIIIFYSYSGNTANVANVLAHYLRGKGEVQLLRLTPLDESGSFFGQAVRALFKKKARFNNDIKFDLSGFDLVCFGTPVWAFAPTPAVGTYLENCSGLKDKKAVVFTTYGSGTGNNRCIRQIEQVLKAKGIIEFRHFSISQFKASNGDFVRGVIEGVFSNF